MQCVHAEIFLVGRDIWEIFEQRTKPARQYLGRESGYTKVKPTKLPLIENTASKARSRATRIQ